MQILVAVVVAVVVCFAVVVWLGLFFNHSSGDTLTNLSFPKAPLHVEFPLFNPVENSETL